MTARPLLVSQRCDRIASYGERRDALDQRWAAFLAEAGFLLVPVPNHTATARTLAAWSDPAGVLLTGGNDIAALGGDVPERDAAEAELIAWARAVRRPVLGICRGAQALMALYGTELGPVAGHVAVRHPLSGDFGAAEVNSFHNFGARTLPAGLWVAARAPDGVVEAFGHRTEAVAGLLWHPEREAPFQPSDLALFRHFFETGQLRIPS